MQNLDMIQETTPTTEQNPCKTNYKTLIFQNLYAYLKSNQPIDADDPLIDELLALLLESPPNREIFISIIDFHLRYDSDNAIFYANKLASLTNNNPLIVYLLGECYFQSGDYSKVNYIFQQNNLLEENLNYVNLAAKGFIKINQFENALKVLNSEYKTDLNNNTLESEKNYLMAMCYKNLENRGSMEEKLMETFHSQPTNMKAFLDLIESKNYSLWELKEEISKPKFTNSNAWLKNYYHYLFTNKQKTIVRSEFEDNNQGMIQEQPQETITNDSLLTKLLNNNDVDLLYLKAKNHFDNYRINDVFETCHLILDRDYFHFNTLLLYAEVLADKGLISELFSCACHLAENYPQHHVTFHIYGMYYFALKKFESARKFFNKAITIEKGCLQSWIMLGHSFASQEESEQAMNVYRSCIRQFPNSHLPHLYLGMEYSRTNSLNTALLSMRQAQQIIGADPVVLNEIGCIYLKESQFDKAKNSFYEALKNCEGNGINWLKQIILNNLGNSHRKFQEFKEAISCYEESLKYSGNDPSVIFSLAFCYHLIGQYKKAINLYHKVIIMKYDTHFVNHMLVHCMEDFAKTEKLQA